MKRYYLAIDIGASSGRHILGHMEDGKMVLEEIYRFPNGMQKQDGEKVWDIEALFEAVLAGMKKCRELGKIPVSVGIDTWAVDFVLLDRMISGSEMPLLIAMTARKEWMRRFIAQCRRKNSMHRPVFRNRFLTVFISLWRGRRKNRNSWKKQRLF